MANNTGETISGLGTTGWFVFHGCVIVVIAIIWTILKIKENIRNKRFAKEYLLLPPTAEFWSNPNVTHNWEYDKDLYITFKQRDRIQRSNLEKMKRGWTPEKLEDYKDWITPTPSNLPIPPAPDETQTPT